MSSDDPLGSPAGAPPPAVHHDPLVGAVLDGRYRVTGTLGAGGVADVYRGETEGMRRKVAIKVLQEDFGANENLRGRFEREARALASLSHPHIVTMIDYGVTEGMPYLVMELLEGRTLADLLAEEKTLPPERAFHISRQIVRALIFAHAQGLIHRDLKPANVFLQDLPGEADHVKILDFGFAKFLAGDDGPALTRTGMVFGTPPYMAPEQVTGPIIDGRCDIYATAVMLFQMFVARRPFEGPTQELLRQKLTEPAPRLVDVDPELVVHPALDALLVKCLDRDPNNRCATAAELGEALDAIPQPAVHRRGSWDSLAAESHPAPAGPPLAQQPASAGTPKAARANAPAAAPPLRTWKVAAGVAAAALLVVIAGIGVRWVVASRAATASPNAAAAAGEGSRATAGETAAGNANPGSHVDLGAPNPWRQPAPAPLSSVRGEVQAGAQVSNDEVRALRAYARAHPDDPRPHLLMGHIYFTRGWLSDAIERFLLAHDVAPGRAKGDPQMLVDLVAMAAGPDPVGTKASAALATIYGQAAVPAVDAALARRSLQPGQQARLERVRRMLAR